MEHKRSSVAAGALLILLGLVFLAIQTIPALQGWLEMENTWPLIVVSVGVGLLVIGLAIGVPEMAIPACIVGGIGGLLFWQNATESWESWAYAWTLIPGFVGVGMILAGLLRGGSRGMSRSGMNLIMMSLVFFAIFGSFFGALGFMGSFWPVLLIAVGALLIAWSVFRSR